MILTITMNPSIDFTYFIDSLTVDKLNRTKRSVRNVGGKGINAGRTAALSGADVILTGFLGGKIGTLTRDYLKDEDLFRLEMTQIESEIRTAITIMHDDNQHTEVVETGPLIQDEEIFELLFKVKKIVADEPITSILICGSVNTNNDHIFKEIIDYIRREIDNELPILVDISGIQLKNLLQTKGNKPTFIKPNEHELSHFLDTPVKTKKEAYLALRHESFSNIPYVIASLGGDGAVCKIDDDFYQASIPQIEILSVTGSGDATVGGFAYALEQKFDLIQAIKYAMACGMSNARHRESGKIDKEEVAKFMEQIIVEKL